MNFNILTIFPEMFPGPLGFSVTGKALKKKLFALNSVNVRDFSDSKHKTVDDKPFGGGAGMIMMAETLQKSLDYVKETQSKKSISIYLSPKGVPLNQRIVKDISIYDNINIVCGRYEGIDQRFLDYNDIKELSVGDYVLTGGEFAAFILIDACVRLIPEVLGNKKSLNYESFEGYLLEYPHYTKPSVWNNINVPEVLLSGDHKKIAEWREKKAIEITKKTRPDLWKLYKLNQGKKK